MLPEGKCRYIDGQIYPDGNFYVLDTQHIKHDGNELKSVLNGISTDISNKVDKETGKGLSTNDYTTAEKNKLSGIEANANNYVHPTTSGNKHIPGGGSSGKILGWSADGTAAWVDPASSGGSVDTVYIGSTEYAPDANGKVTLPTYPTTLPASDVYSWAKASSKPTYTASEVGAAASSHTHKYAGSSSAGGAATSANKLNTNAGSATQPVYFSNGVPVATTYSLAKSVPSNAKFTDTTYSAATQSANGLMSANDKCLMYQLIALDNLSSVSVSAPLYSRAQYSDVYTIFPRTVYVTKAQLGISNSNVIAAAKITSDDSRVPGISAVTIDNANNRIGVTFTETLYADIRVTFVVAYN